MPDPVQRSTSLVLRITRTRTGAVRIEHGYQTEGAVDAFELWAQIPSAERRIRTVWNELRVLLAIYLERERPCPGLCLQGYPHQCTCGGAKIAKKAADVAPEGQNKRTGD